MAIVLYSAFGFAALRNADRFWASATFSLAVISVLVAVVGAFGSKKETRMSWAGFAVAGGVSLVIWIATYQNAGYVNGPPPALLYILQPYINPAASGGGHR
jgi:hypothetical protein